MFRQLMMPYDKKRQALPFLPSNIGLYKKAVLLGINNIEIDHKIMKLIINDH